MLTIPHNLLSSSLCVAVLIDIIMDQAEIPAMTELHDTYGKTVHTCESGVGIEEEMQRGKKKNEQDEMTSRERGVECLADRRYLFVGQYDKYPDFPMGPPQLMMSYTNDGQVPQQMVKERDE
jgi:hypothetical protein